MEREREREACDQRAASFNPRTAKFGLGRKHAKLSPTGTKWKVCGEFELVIHIVSARNKRRDTSTALLLICGGH